MQIAINTGWIWTKFSMLTRKIIDSLVLSEFSFFLSVITLLTLAHYQAIFCTITRDGAI